MLKLLMSQNINKQSRPPTLEIKNPYDMEKFKQVINEEKLTITDLMNFDMQLTFDRNLLQKTFLFGSLLSVDDFVYLFGVRPVEFSVAIEEIIPFFYNSLHLRQTSVRKQENKFFVKCHGIKTMDLDYTFTFLIHPTYVKYLLDFYRVLPIRQILEVMEMRSIMHIEGRPDPPHDMIDRHLEEMSSLEAFGYIMFLGEDVLDFYIDQNQGPFKMLQNLFFRSGFTNINEWVDTIENQQVVHSEVRDVNRDIRDGDGIELRFKIQTELEPYIQTEIPSRAEIEREYRDYIHSQRNNKAGIPKDKKKTKKMKLNKYQKTNNLDKSSFNFYNPNPQKNKNKISEEALEALRYCAKFVRKPVGFWTAGSQRWLERFDLDLPRALQLFSSLRRDETGTDSDTAVGSMINFKLPRHRVNYYSLVAHEASNMEEAWIQQLQSHYDKNDHHPEHYPKAMMSIKATVELWFDLLASAMRIEKNANDAFYLMLDWVFEYVENSAQPKKKYLTLSPQGTVYFIAIIAQRGLSTQDCRIVHPRLRNAPLTSDEKGVDLLSLYNRNYGLVRTQKETQKFLDLPKVKDYLRETQAHVELVNRELTRYRISPRHDRDKFEFQSIIAYVYKWSWPKIEGTSLDAFLEKQDRDKPHTSKPIIEDEFQDAISDPGFLTKIRNGVSNTFNKLHGKMMAPISEPLKEATDKALEVLQHMSGMFEDIYNKIKDFFSKLTGLPLPNLQSTTTIIALIMDYLIFVNVDNVLLKAAVIVNALNRIGISKILEKASSYLKDFINVEEEKILEDGKVEGTNDDGTSSGFWTCLVEWITDINPRNAGIVAGILISGLLGYSIFGGKKEIEQLGKKIVDGMRSMSFIGMGFVGVGNVVKYIASIFREVANWIKKKCGLLNEEEKKDEEVKKMTKDILEWASKLDFYFSGDGLAVIKNSKAEFENAKKVAQGYFFYNAASHDPIVNMPLDLKREVRSRHRKALDLLNFMHRLNASTHFRSTPFHLQFYGKAGVGKSELLKDIIKKFHRKYFNYVGIEKFVYSPNTNKEHWDGYWGQLCIVVDEMWATLDAETLTEWLTIISCMPVLLPMAALEDKVDAYFRGRLILSCTNVPYPRANGVACMDAVWRRRLLVETLIDPDVFDKNSGMFSMTKFQKKYPDADPKEFPHLTFNIMRSVEDASEGMYYSQGAVLPDGIAWPTSNLSYEQLLKMAYSSFDALQAKEGRSVIEQEDMYAEWEVMINEVMQAFGKDSLTKSRDFVTANRMSLEVEDVPVCEGSILYEEHVLEIVNPPIDMNITIDDEFDKIVVDKCCAGKHHLVSYTVDNVRWLIDFKNKTVNKGKGKIEPLNRDHRKAILNLAPYFEDEFKRRFESVEPTSLSKNHRCSPESIVPDILSISEALDLGYTIGQYLNHVKVCRAGKYSYESIVDFVNTVTYPSTTQSLIDCRQDYLRNGKRFKAYNISLKIIAQAENEEKDEITYYNFIGHAEMFKGELVPNYKEWKETYVRLDESFDEQLVDLVSPNTKRETVYDMVEHETNFLNDWDRIFLSDSERLKIFKNKISTRTKISYFFLEHLEYDKKKDQWYLRWSKRLSWYAHIIASKINLDAGFDEFTEPYEVTYLMNFAWFRDSYKQWFELTPEERKYLYETRGLRQKIFQYYSRAHYYIKTVIKVAYQKTLGKFFGTLKYVWTKYYWFFKTLSLIGCAYSAIYLFKNFGSLFSPKIEGTSRVYFKKAANTIRNVIPTSLNEDNFLEGIKNNILEVSYLSDKANAVGLGEHVILVNHHFLSKAMKEDNFELALRPTARSLDWISYVVYGKDIYHIPETDLLLVFSRDFPVYRKLVHKFRTDEQLLKHHIKTLSLYYNLSGTIHISEFPYTEIAPFVGYDEKGIRIMNTRSIHYKGQPPRGSSGGVLYAVDNYCNNYIVGIQCWRDNKMGFGNILTQEMLREALSKFADKMIQHEGPYELVEGTSTTEQLIEGHILVEGLIPEEHVTGIVYKSSFEKTPIYKSFPSKRIPAILTYNDERVPPGTHPLQHSVNKSGRDIMKPIKPELLSYAEQQVSLYYIDKMKNFPLRLLTFEETLTGLPESGSVSLNTKTSPGIPWIYGRKSPGKKDYITIGELGDIEFCADEVREEFFRVEESLKKRIIPKTSMYEFPKDELRPVAKALGPPIKTRSITVMNFIYNLIWRKYHMSFETYLHQMADGTEPYCIGINPESLSWQRMYDSLRAVGTHGCDLDVGNWDGHFTSQLMRAANEVSNNVYKSQGMNDDNVRDSLIDHNVFGSFQFLDIVCRKMRGLPSGCAGTPHLNTLGHIILLFTFFCELYKKEFSVYPTFRTFLKLVCVRFYSDDVMMTISPVIVNWWNGATIAEAYTYYGWPTTSAQKTDALYQLVPCESLTFLKRAFVKHAKYGLVVGALEKDVIVDLLHWMRRTANDEEQFYLNVKNALEYSWFHGEQYYRRMFTEINNALKMENMKCVFYTYEFMTEEILNRIRDPLNL